MAWVFQTEEDTCIHESKYYNTEGQALFALFRYIKSPQGRYVREYGVKLIASKT